MKKYSYQQLEAGQVHNNTLLADLTPEERELAIVARVLEAYERENGLLHRGRDAEFSLSPADYDLASDPTGIEGRRVQIDCYEDSRRTNMPTGIVGSGPWYRTCTISALIDDNQDAWKSGFSSVA